MTAESTVNTAHNRGFGIDIGGSGVKGGIVDLGTGVLIGERHKIPTPSPPPPMPLRRPSHRSSGISAGTVRSG